MSLVLGARDLDEDDWVAIQEAPVVGISADWGRWYWPVNLATTLWYSSEKASFPLDQFATTEFDLTTAEFAVGFQRAWPGISGRVEPFLGAGVAAVYADVEVEVLTMTASDDDLTPGAYWNGGIRWRTGNGLNLGFEGRILLGTDVEIGEGDKTFALGALRVDNVDYVQFGLLIGWGR